MKWLIYGIFAAILFGFWGLFDKLSASLNPFTSNIIIYLTAFILACFMIMKTKKIQFSKYSFLAGLFAGIGNFFVLYALLKNLLILVLPFVSVSAAIFFLIVYFTEKPKYSGKQKIFAYSGLLLSIVGIIFIATASNGLFNFVKDLTLESSYIIPALFIMVGFSLWTYFTYKSVSKEKINARIYNFWNLLASFLTALIAIIILNLNSLKEIFSISFNIYPMLAGICIAGGTLLTYAAFKTTTTKTRLQETMVAILANGELIPLLLLSYFVLGEWIPQGFIGVIIALIGLILVHLAEISK
jgi:hypothetical protein